MKGGGRMVSGLSGLPFGNGKGSAPLGARTLRREGDGTFRRSQNQSGRSIETARICPTEEETMRWSRMCGKAHYI